MRGNAAHPEPRPAEPSPHLHKAPSAGHTRAVCSCPRSDSGASPSWPTHEPRVPPGRPIPSAAWAAEMSPIPRAGWLPAGVPASTLSPGRGVPSARAEARPGDGKPQRDQLYPHRPPEVWACRERSVRPKQRRPECGWWGNNTAATVYSCRVNMPPTVSCGVLAWGSAELQHCLRIIL